MDKKTVEILNTGISLSEWFEKINHDQTVELRDEDNEKRERLKVLAEIINLPYDVPVQFTAKQIADRDPEFQTYLAENGDKLCALRLIPLDSHLPKLRMRGQSLNDVLTWFAEQKIDLEKYRADIIPHSETEEWSTIFVINDNGIYGEILAGKPIELTHGVFLADQPITFSYENEKWNLSTENEAALEQLKEVTTMLKIPDPKKRELIKNELEGEFLGDYLKGYFETVKTGEFGVWFIDYNRILGKLYADFKTIEKSEQNSAVILSGSCGSRGKVTGKVKLVDPDEVNKIFFATGEILVTKFTSPDFVPLMQKAAAVVTDMGGILSHASIIARELKIPCVVGTKNATEILKTGDIIEVDADKGEIRMVNNNFEKELSFAQHGLILDKTKSKLLVSKYKSSQYLPEKLAGKLCLPGGKLKHGESLEAAFEREILEETGIKVNYGEPIYTWTWIYQKDEKLIQVVANAIICQYQSGIVLEKVDLETETNLEPASWVEIKGINLDDFVIDERPAVRILLDQLAKN